MFDFLFRRKQKLSPEFEAALGEGFVSDLRALAKSRLDAEDLEGIARNDAKSWLQLAVCSYIADSIETAKIMGRPVSDAQDLVAASHVVWVALQQGSVLSRGVISQEDAASAFEVVVLLASTIVMGENVPDSLVREAAAAGRRDAETFEGDKKLPVNRAISIDFQDYIASKNARLARFLGQFLKRMDATA